MADKKQSKYQVPQEAFKCWEWDNCTQRGFKQEARCEAALLYRDACSLKKMVKYLPKSSQQAFNEAMKHLAAFKESVSKKNIGR